MYTEDEYLMLSGIQHYVFCRRQWALIHLEQQWEENFRTADGRAMHNNVHDSSFNEKRKDIIITRGMSVFSSELGIIGECDVVEFHKSDDGVELSGRDGKYNVVPIEYKRGNPKEDDSDSMQLMAQAMCLESMLCCRINFGYLYYGETRHRLKIVFDDELRNKTIAAIDEMHKMYRTRHTPKVKRSKACNACSLKEICLPVICGNISAERYIQKMLSSEDDENEEIT